MATNPRYANGARRRALRARVLARDTNCWLCKKPVDKSVKTPHPLSPEVHEVIPISRGGSPYDINNCVLCCRQCNNWIGDRTPDELRSDMQPKRPEPFRTSQAW